MKVKLILNADGATKVFPVTSEIMTIGRGHSSQVRLADVSISREHCLIEKIGDQYVLRDLASANGTFVNGDPITEWVLRPDDKIQIGESTFTFASDSSEVPAKTHGCNQGAHGKMALSEELRKEKIRVDAVVGEERAVRLLTLGYEVFKTVPFSEALDRVSEQLVKRVLEIFGPGRALVFFFNNDGSLQNRVGIEMIPEERVLRATFEESKSFLFKDEGVGTAILVPVRGHQRVYGALYFDATGTNHILELPDLHGFSIVGHQIGLALEPLRSGKRSD